MEKKEPGSSGGFEPQIASRCVPVEPEEPRGCGARCLRGNGTTARFPFQMVDKAALQKTQDPCWGRTQPTSRYLLDSRTSATPHRRPARRPEPKRRHRVVPPCCSTVLEEHEREPKTSTNVAEGSSLAERIPFLFFTQGSSTR